MSLKNFSEVLEKNGCVVKISGDKLELDLNDNKIWTEVPEDWVKAINGFFRAKQYKFDQIDRVLTANKFCEFPLVRLNAVFLPRPEYVFVNKTGDKVTVKQASKEFILSNFASEIYKDGFQIIERRIKRRCDYRAKGKDQRIRIRFEDLLIVPNTATYFPKRKIDREKIASVAVIKVRNCLFNLAYSYDECWEIRSDIKTKPIKAYNVVEEDEELEIPNVTYNEDLVKHYKIAKSSQFPGQAFLSYYHILEYFFLRVADDDLFNSVKAHLNRPNFKATYDNVNKLLSEIKKHDNIHDENEMLKAVLKRYVPEDALIEFLKDTEKELGENVYSDKNGIIFGESMFIKLAPGHALSNSAKIVKHIRNSLVHSSDRHNRNDCFRPFSETESLVIRHIPLVKYLAEKVLFSTAT